MVLEFVTRRYPTFSYARPGLEGRLGEDLRRPMAAFAIGTWAAAPR
jgi:hypothetical protein